MSTKAKIEEMRLYVNKISKILADLEGQGQMVGNPYEGTLEFYQEHFFVPLEEIDNALPNVTCRHLDLKMDDFEAFLRDYLPWHEKIAKRLAHKKKLELFISFSLLGDRAFESYLDAAGGGFSYAGTLKAKQSHLQDMEIRDAVKKRCGPDVNYVESSLTSIPLEDNSLDAISSHHAFEHFQGSADMDFIREAQRILKTDGRLVLVPLFIARDYLEMTNLAEFSNWSTEEKNRLFDPTASLPGKKSGHFARIYNLAMFQERVLSKIDFSNFAAELVEVTLEGRPVPDPVVYATHKVSNFNYPYRAFMLTKTG